MTSTATSEIGIETRQSAWRKLELRDLCLKVAKAKRKEFSPHESLIYLDIGGIDNSVHRIKTHKVYRWNEAPSRAQQVVQVDDILFSTVRTYMKNIAMVVDQRYNNQIASSGFCVIRANKEIVLPKYLFYYSISNEFLKPLNALQTGSSYPAVRDKDVFNQPIPLPDIEEQRLIVSKIEELFSELDKGIEQLKTAQQKLRRYRRAIFKHAFGGKLGIKQSDETSWETVTIEDLATCLDNLRKPVNKNERAKRQGSIPYYGANGRTGWIDSYLFDEPLILVVEDETFVGREMPFSYKITGKSWVNNHAHILKPKDGVDIDFLNYQLFYYPFLAIVTGTTGRKKLTKRALMSAPVKLCSIQHQKQIVQEIESRLSVADKLEETINNSLLQAESLRQSILKKAFEGKLLSQAELERIRELTKSVKPRDLKIAAEPQATYKKKKSNDLFPKRIEGIKDTDLHAGILAMVIDAHEKSPEHHMKLSHVKGEKIVHLVEAHIGIYLGRNPRKDAAGPDDFPHLKKVESRAMKAGWFGVKKLRVGQTYVSKQGMPKIIQKVKETLPHEDLSRIEALIRTFLPFELEHTEVIATLYAGWNNLLLERKNPTDEEIVYESRENWSKRKLGIERETFFKALKWVKEHALIPKGRGKVVFK